MEIVSIPRVRLTIADAASIAGVSSGTIQRAIKSGQLKAYTVKRPYYILVEDYMDYVKKYLSRRSRFYDW